MRALFVVPPSDLNAQNTPIDRVYGCNYGYDYKPPIHHLLLATYARQLGCEVEFIDCPARGWGSTRLFHQLAKVRFDVVVFQSVYLSVEEDLACSKMIRERLEWGRDAHLIFWGTGGAWSPEQLVLDSRCWVITSEPEGSFAAWLGAMETDTSPLGLPGLIGADANGSLVRGGFRPLTDITSLPIPDRRLLAGGRYRLNRLDARPITSAVFSRGCGYRCTFCTPMAVDQAIELEFKKPQETYKKRPPLRLRTVDQVVAEFEDIAAAGYRAVEVADNLFTHDADRVEEICHRIAPLGLQWTCLARADQLTAPRVAKALAAGGCKMVYMGSESFDDRALAEMKKGLRSSSVAKAVDNLRAAGVEPEVSVLMGAVEGETPESIRRNVAAARALGTRFVHYSVALPSPSTELYDIARRKGWFVRGDFEPIDNAKDAIIDLPGISSAQLRREVKRAYLTQYTHPKAMLLQLSRVRSPGDLADKLMSGWKLLRFSMAREVRPGLRPE